MELSIKDIDRILQTFDKFHDTLYEISNSLITIKEVLQVKFSENILHYEGEHFLERIKQEFFDEEK